MPKGEGPHPVVVVMHGLHHNCVFSDKPPYFPRKPVKAQWPLVCAAPGEPHNPNLAPDYLRHDVGLSHVVQALTRKGFAAVSIDVVSPEHWWAGETVAEKGYTDLVNAHLRLLSDLNKGVNHGLDIPGGRGGSTRPAWGWSGTAGVVATSCHRRPPSAQASSVSWPLSPP
ncbi:MULTISPECIES: hypothetical protein [unclassified Streptomyces]|uniref:hypothetical protein n=1 Tax=unclassified Streptomyces TaxID=2593676 RepID=UPI00114CF31E|nr:MULTISPECIES: hypothetical protein [unclassified Streptomyces]MYT11442.1 hypothetical protein [Streptomyces sp. SID4951]